MRPTYSMLWERMLWLSRDSGHDSQIHMGRFQVLTGLWPEEIIGLQCSHIHDG